MQRANADGLRGPTASPLCSARVVYRAEFFFPSKQSRATKNPLRPLGLGIGIRLGDTIPFPVPRDMLRISIGAPMLEAYWLMSRSHDPDCRRKPRVSQFAASQAMADSSVGLGLLLDDLVSRTRVKVSATHSRGLSVLPEFLVTLLYLSYFDARGPSRRACGLPMRGSFD